MFDKNSSKKKKRGTFYFYRVTIRFCIKEKYHKTIFLYIYKIKKFFTTKNYQFNMKTQVFISTSQKIQKFQLFFLYSQTLMF